MTVFSFDTSMYAMARLIQTLHIFDAPFLRFGLPLGWILHLAILLSAIIVLGYIFLGGLTSAISNEVLQFSLIVAGFPPLVRVGLKNVGCRTYRDVGRPEPDLEIRREKANESGSACTDGFAVPDRGVIIGIYGLITRGSVIYQR
jgi:hypothetical protein